MPKVGEHGCTLNETIDEYHLVVELQPSNRRNDGDTVETIAKRARVKLVHDSYGSASYDAELLSEAGGIKLVTIQKQSTHTVKIEQCVIYNGKIVKKHGKPYEAPPSRKERKENKS